MRVGVVVNPIAGLGGTVGLKGTDGALIVAEALRRGAQPQAGNRVRRAFERLATQCPGTTVFAAPGKLGADYLVGLDLVVEVVGPDSFDDTADDTREMVRAMPDIDVLVFAGGDGTARDVSMALGGRAAMLGIPCGVKMHSGVFAISPESAGNLLGDLVAYPDRVQWADDVEIMDIDEEALRAGSIAPQLYGLVRSPRSRNRVQAAKGAPRRDDPGHLRAAARQIAASMEAGTLYIIGPGTSAAQVAEALGIDATVLGVDAVLDGELMLRDATAAQLEQAVEGRKIRLVLSVTGRQGFLLGRGNQQISQAIIAKAGRDGLIILAGENKVAELVTPMLAVDTGNPQLDIKLHGYVRVHTGHARFTLLRIHSG